VKNILKDQNVKISCNTSFDEFQKLIRSDNRGKNIDIANLKLSYNNLVDKVIEKEKDTAKETSKKVMFVANL
jgi:hypothetical protein